MYDTIIYKLISDDFTYTCTFNFNREEKENYVSKVVMVVEGKAEEE